MELVNVMVRILHAGDIKTTNNNLTLKEYIATDDGKFQMKIAMLSILLIKWNLNNRYKILNLQLVTYLNERKLRNTTLSKVEKIDKDIPDLKMKRMPESIWSHVITSQIGYFLSAIAEDMSMILGMKLPVRAPKP